MKTQRTWEKYSTSQNLLEDFHCRFMILEDVASSLTGTVETALIRYYKPIWNTQIDGFGNHNPGKGRYYQTKSEWVNRLTIIKLRKEL